MRNIHVSTVLVLIAVVFAGCSGGGVTADGPATASDTAATGTDGSGGDGARADTDGLSVTDADERLREAGSFTTQWSYSVTGSDGTTEAINNTYRVDLADNRSLTLFSTTGTGSQTEIATFVSDGTSYIRYGDGEDVFYQVSEQYSDVLTSATGQASSFEGTLESDTQFVGTETFDGVTVSRYEYSDPNAWQTYGAGTATFGDEANATVTDFTVVVLVDENGISRLTMWTLSGETENGTPVSAEWRYSLTDIGETTVEDPDWLDEAQS